VGHDRALPRSVAGAVTIDGVDLRNATLASVRGASSRGLSQETIRSRTAWRGGNIAFGMDDVPQAAWRKRPATRTLTAVFGMPQG